MPIGPDRFTTTVSLEFRRIRPIRAFAVTVALLLLAGGTLLVGLWQDALTTAFLLVVGSAGAGGLGLAGWATLTLDDQIRSSECEFDEIEESGVEAFLAASAASPTPSRAALHALYQASLRTGGSVPFRVVEPALRHTMSRPAQRIQRIGSFCLLCGILGTAASGWVSLTAMSTTVARAGEGPEVLQAMAGPGGTIAGVALAFSTTVAGITVKIGLNELASTLYAQARDYCEHVQELVGTYITPSRGDDDAA